MPRIPIYEQQTSAQGSGGPRASANDFGAQIGAALGDAARGIGQIANTFDVVAQENGKAYGANATATLALASEQWKKDNIGKMADNGEGYTKQGLGWYDEYTQKMLDNAPDDTSRRYLKSVIEAQKDNFGKSLIDQEYRSNLAWRESQITSATQNAAKAVYENPALLKSAMVDIKAQVAAMNLPPERRIELLQKFDEQVALAAVTNFIDNQAPQNPNVVLSTIKQNAAPDVAGISLDAASGDILNNPEAMAVLDKAVGGTGSGAAASESSANPEIASAMAMLPVDVQRSVMRQAESVGNKIKAQNSSDLAIKVDSAASLDQLPDPTDIDLMAANGRLEKDNAYRLKKAVEEKQVKFAELESNVRSVQAALAGGLPVDYKAKGMVEAADNVYAEYINAYTNRPVADQNATKAFLVSKMGFVPSALQQEIRQSVRSNNPEQVMNAVDVVNRLRQASPNALNDLQQDDLRYLNAIQAKMAAGYSDPANAVRVVNDLMKIDESQKEARKAEYDQIIKNNPSANWMARQLNSILRFDPVNDAVMLRELDDNARQEYQITGDIKGARQTVLDEMQKVWGLSSVGSDGVKWKKWAPEKFYGVPTMSNDDNAKWMNEQLLHDVSKNSMSATSMEGRLSVIYNPAQSLGDRPTYNVILKDENGVLRHMQGTNGRPLVWVPSYENSPAYARKQKELADNVAAAKAKRDAAIKGQ